MLQHQHAAAVEGSLGFIDLPAAAASDGGEHGFNTRQRANAVAGLLQHARDAGFTGQRFCRLCMCRQPGLRQAPMLHGLLPQAQQGAGLEGGAVAGGLDVSVAVHLGHADALAGVFQRGLRFAQFGQHAGQVAAPLRTDQLVPDGVRQHQQLQQLVAGGGQLTAMLGHHRQVQHGDGRAVAAADALIGGQRLLSAGRGLRQAAFGQIAHAQIVEHRGLGVGVAGGACMRQCSLGVRTGFFVAPLAAQRHDQGVVGLGSLHRGQCFGCGQTLRAQQVGLFVVAIHAQAVHAVLRGNQPHHVVVLCFGEGLQGCNGSFMFVRVAPARADAGAHAQQGETALRVAAAVERQRAIGVRQRRAVGVAGARFLRGQCPVFSSTVRYTGAFEVFCDEARELGTAPDAARFQPQRGTVVLLAFVTLEHGAIGDLVQQVVAKSKFPGVAKSALGVRQRQRTLAQRQQLAGCARVQRGQRVVPEHGADHAGLLQRTPLRRQQGVQPGLQHTHQRGRHLHLPQAFGRQLPGRGGSDQHALVDQHLQQRFHVERVAFGALDQQLLQRWRVRVSPQRLQKRTRQHLAVVRCERLQDHALMGGPRLAPGGPPLPQFGPCGAQQQQRQVAAGAGQVLDGIERTVIGPVQVVQHHHQHGRGQQRRARQAQVLDPGVKGTRTQLLAVLHDARDKGAGAVVHADQLAQ